MKAAVIREPGATPEHADFGEPIVSEGRMVAKLVAAGIHPVVRSLAAGLQYGSTGQYPLVPGVDAVARTAEGTLVYTGYIQPPYGTLAERMAIPAATQSVLPEGAQPERVAGGINPGMSSWLPLRTRLEDSGSLGTVLVLGATGMAGQLAVQNARLLGSDRVVAAGRDGAGLQRAAGYGASTTTLDGDRQSVATALAQALAGDSPGLVLDFVWGPPAEAAFAVLTRTGPVLGKRK